MKIPRSYIVPDNSIVHMTWRCHNQSYLLDQTIIKHRIISLYFQKASKYNIRIIDFILMDNHVHFVLLVSTAKNLGDFARCVNSQIATFVNKILKRDSQVIRDRYKSPIVLYFSHLCELLGYVWLNRYKIDSKRRDPRQDYFCSAYHRKHKTNWGKQLISYSELGLCKVKDELSLLHTILNEYLRKFKEKLKKGLPLFNSSNFNNRFIVGSKETVRARSKAILHRMKNHLYPSLPKPNEV